LAAQNGKVKLSHCDTAHLMTRGLRTLRIGILQRMAQVVVEYIGVTLNQK
jgi:hypothetical protein